MRIRLLSVAICIAGLCLPVVQAAPPLADHMPANSVLYIGWAGRNLPFDGSMLGQLIQQPAMAEIVRAAREAILANADGAEEKQAIEHMLAIASLAAKHKIGLCITDQPALRAPEGDRRAPRIPAAALLVDLGKDRQAMAEHIDRLLDLFSQETKTPIGTGTAGAVKYKTLKPERDAPVVGIGCIGDTLFVTVGEELPAQLVSLSEAADHSLLNSAKFAAAYKDVAGDNEQVSMYVDIPAAAAIVRRSAGQDDEVAKLLAALGVGKITTMVSATRVVERGFYTKTRILSPAPHRGLLLPLAGPALSDAEMAVAPADTLVWLAAKIDPTALFAEIKRVVGALDERAASEFDEGIAQVEKQLGLSIEKDLLAHLGGQVSVVSAPSLGGFLTGTAVVITLKDEAAFAKTLAKIEGFARAAMTPPPADGPDSYAARRRRDRAPAMRTATVGKTTITYVQIPDDDVPVAPAWAIHEGKLIVAAWPQVVQAVIEGPGQAGALTANPAFLAARKHIAGRPSSLAYLNLPGILRQAYGLPMFGWTIIANMAQRDGVGLRPHWLPPLGALEKYLWPMLSTVSTDEAGITIEQYGSLPTGALVAPAGLMLNLAVPAVSAARAESMDMREMAMLRQLGIAIQAYRVDNGKTPPNLAALDKYIRNTARLDPVIYIPLPDNAPGQLIQAYKRMARPGGDRVFLLLQDGSVRRMDADETFRKLLADSQAAAMPADNR